MAEQPAEGSPASVENRLEALFSAEGEPPVDAPEVAAETAAPVTEESEPDAEDDEGQEPAIELVEVEDDAGKKHQIPAELKDAFERRADYTRKTQQAATLAKAADDRMQFAEAKEQVLGAILQDYSALQEKQARLAQLNNLDLGALYNADPGQVFNIQKQIRDLEREVADGQRGLQGKAQHVQNTLKQHQEKQWSLAVEGAKQALGTVTPSDDAAMLQQVQKMGFLVDELKGRFADPRFLQMVFKAAKWDSLQSGKPTAIKTATNAPPVLKPGASNGSGEAGDRKYRDARAALKKSGSVDAAARLFLMRG